jgi:hypothetical protein
MLWRWLEPRIQAMITNRILDFYEGMIRRGEIQMVAQSGVCEEMNDAIARPPFSGGSTELSATGAHREISTSVRGRTNRRHRPLVARVTRTEGTVSSA